MRIIAGRFKGRTLTAPRGSSTRPTTDRVREAVFSALTSLLGSDLGGGRALDAFAGSGALGLEAFSRGVEHVAFVESSRTAASVLRRNTAALGANDSTAVVIGNVLSLAERGALPDGPFALLLLDPPYTLSGSEITRMVGSLADHEQLEDGALVVYEHAAGTDPEWPQAFSTVTRKRYGSTEVDIVRYEREDSRS
jgi:16S rRNA (guanine966-N2)-methyltransferase